MFENFPFRPPPNTLSLCVSGNQIRVASRAMHLHDALGRVAAGCAEYLPKEELAKLQQRLSRFDGSITAEG